MSRPPNLGLQKQQTQSNPAGPSPFTKTPQQADQIRPGLQAEDDGEERNVPSELRSRPKIPRTPADGEGRDRRTDQDMPQSNNQPVLVKIKGELVEDETKLKEHGEGFLSREKIARTPPDDETRRYPGGGSSLGQYQDDIAS